MKSTLSGKICCTFSFILLVLLLSLNSLTQFANSQTSVFTDVLRLHVIASSDKNADQELKLKVRDDILEVTGMLFGNCTDIQKAIAIAKKNKALLLETAKNTVKENGFETKVDIKISKEFYPEKTYGELTFPKGEYLSVRIVLGNGKGKNWWCVLFPPLCNAGVIESKDTLSNYGFDKQEIEMLESGKQKGINVAGTRVSLKLLELFLQE